MSEQLIQTPCAFGENGNFLLEREIGSGGMGGVYMGRDKMLDRPVAVKVMLKELGSDPEFVEKFKKEAQSAARLIHPNIAQIYSYGICDGMPYMAMELAAGGSLFSIMNANPGKTDVARVIKICQQVAQALQCASDQGFVHGDVKPENILLDSNGNAKLVDFGLAAMQKDTKEIWGTPYYISPEKVKKETTDFRSDMYSLGGTLYHALTGVAPFEGADSIAVVKKRFEGAPKKPSEIRTDLTPAIDALVLKMLAMDRCDRYPSFEALLEAFKDVLTNGLTASQPQESVVSAGGAKTTTGTRRMTTVRGRRTVMTKSVPAGKVKKPLTSAESDGVEEISDINEDEEEEGGGSLGVKVIGVIIGIILLIGAVVGGLIWYQVADKKARAAEECAQIAAGIGKAREAIRDTVSSAEKFADEFDAFAAKAIVECQKPTDELMKILPEEQGALLKPGPTKELLDAIASTNEVQALPAEIATNVVGAATNGVPAVGQAQQASGATQPVLAKFRDPTEDEKDPASPEGEAYLKAKKEFQAAQLKKLKETGKTVPAPAVQPEHKNAQQAASEKKNESTAQAVVTMNDLWGRAYSCQASAVKIRHAVRKVIAKGREADEIKEQTREAMDKLADLSRVLVDMLNQIKTSKDVENVSKGITFIKNKGEKTVAQTVKQIRIDKLHAERDAAAKAAAEAEAARKKEQAEARQKKIEEEVSAAKSKFDAIVTQGCFRQLDWKSALRMLTSLKAEMTTPEGQLACDLELRKINDMKMVHDIFIKNLKGHTFRGKLKNAVVDSVNEKELVLYRKGNQNKLHIAWQKFYKEYPGNLNEIMNMYIVNARLPNAKVRMNSLLEWANAMTGAALTMQLVCGEVNGAMERSELLVKTIVKQFPEYEKTAKDIFPEIKLDDVASEE